MRLRRRREGRRRQKPVDGGKPGQGREGVFLTSSWLTRTGQSQAGHDYAVPGWNSRLGPERP
jgi:hypothetical protein